MEEDRNQQQSWRAAIGTTAKPDVLGPVLV